MGINQLESGGGTNRTGLGVGRPDKVILSGPTVRPDAAPIRPDAPPIRPNTTPIGPNTAPIRPDALPIRPDTALIRPNALLIGPDTPPIGPNAPLPWDGRWACRWVSVERRWKWWVCVGGVVGGASVERQWRSVERRGGLGSVGGALGSVGRASVDRQ